MAGKTKVPKDMAEGIGAGIGRFFEKVFKPFRDQTNSRLNDLENSVREMRARNQGGGGDK